MEVFAPTAEQRRLLVELLANEFEGTLDLRLDPARATTLAQLVAQGWVSRSQGWCVLTRAGQEIAIHLADRMLGVERRIEGCA
ncbi:MAG: hypothetical protein ACE37F_21205 [Nannocystaceae bacterium]|nr:hypothetical protein [bacterium]